MFYDDHRKKRQKTFPHNLPLNAREIPDMMSSMFELTTEPVVVLNILAQVVSVNPAFKKKFGYELEDVYEMPTASFYAESEKGREDYDNFIKILLKDGHFKGQIRLRRKDGSQTTVNAEFTAIYDSFERPMHYVGVYSSSYEFSDKTSDDGLNPNKDELTGLINYQTFSQVMPYFLEKVQNDCSVLSLMFIDIDNFKDINNKFGFEKGDYVIKKIAEILVKSTKKKDVIARVGPDEFCVALMDTYTHDIIQEIVARIYENIEAKDAFSDSEVDLQRITISSGIAIFPVAGESFEELYQNAVDAATDARAHGIGNIEYSEFLPDYHYKKEIKKLEVYDPSDKVLINFNDIKKEKDPNNQIDNSNIKLDKVGGSGGK